MNENAKKWVEALRSGEYEQTTGHMRDCSGYCCLGIAEDLRLKEQGGTWVEHHAIDDSFESSDSGSISGNGEASQGRSILTEKTKEWLSLGSYRGDFGCRGECLSSLNDNGVTFARIADIIESEPPGLFVDQQGES